MNSLIITGGTVVLPEGIRRADILAINGKIEVITSAGRLKTGAALRKIDANGLTVLPGIIDSHVHFNLRINPHLITSDDFTSGSAAAACGGITTVIDYTGQPQGTDLLKGIRHRQKEAEGRMYTDYSLHCVIPAWKKLRDPVKQMERAIAAGVPSFKLFMIYEDRGMMADDADIFEALTAAKKLDGLICLHAESDRIIRLLIKKYRNKGLGIRAHALSRPDFTEWEAVQRALTWAKITLGSVYFVHLSAGNSGRLIGLARRAGIKAMGETCPQYLVFEDSVLSGKNGHLFATCPQIKKASDAKLLWEGLKKGWISACATDNCTFNKKQKNSWNNDITRIPFGMPGVQTLLPAIYTHGVKNGRITLGRMTEILSSDPARIMGLYPQKGVIAKGSDADFAIIDPAKIQTVDFKKLKHNCDWSPYQGMKLCGFPEYTVLRGKVIAEKGGLAGNAPEGKFVKRYKPQFV